MHYLFLFQSDVTAAEQMPFHHDECRDENNRYLSQNYVFACVQKLEVCSWGGKNAL